MWHPIRSPREVGELPTAPFLIGITSKQHVQSVIMALKQTSITHHCTHLKAVWMKKEPHILLGFSKQSDLILPIVEEWCDSFYSISLPILPPRSSRQHSMYHSKWPCHLKCNTDKDYLPPSAIEALLASHPVQDQVILVHSNATCAAPSVFDVLNKWSTEMPDEHYLATGMICICPAEPLLDEGMALLHSRIKLCLVYKGNSHNGAFSHFYLHCNPALNHQFQVYVYE